LKTISTKIDQKTSELFLKVCNEEGKCQSEMLRDLIENVCELDETKGFKIDPRIVISVPISLIAVSWIIDIFLAP